MGKTFEGKTNSKYNYVGLPKEMSEEIQRIIESDKRLGFVSIQEFVKEAVRRSIIEYAGTRQKEMN
jgi:Arc/MetJ-type ribon-helix-helix transcriptional regulator